jgi:Na+-translocating ferredoxin:NAD+ oxidoreductase RnfE subunit
MNAKTPRLWGINTEIAQTPHITVKMPIQPTSIQTRKKNLIACLTVTAGTVEALASGLNTPFSVAISNTIQSLLENMVVSN